MKRRSFIETAVGTAALSSGISGCTRSENGRDRTMPEGEMSVSENGLLAGRSIEEVKRQYENDLFEDYLPFHNTYVVEPKYGSFLATTDHDGSHADTNTNASYMGRGIWCYSFLYNNLAKEDKYRDIAWKAVQFIIKHQPSGDDFWPGSYTMGGEVISSQGGYAGDCYIAEGLAEFSKATGDPKYMDLAKETIFKCLKHYDSPDFKDSSIPYPGARSLWYWMLLMWFGTNTLKYEPDSDLESLVARCIDAIMNHHQNPDFDLMNNYINHDLSRSEDPKYSELGACGHATEATWMIMYEAVRTNNKALFDDAAAKFKRHAIVSRDDIYGGYFNDLTNVDKNIWQLSKISWAQAFILINSLYIVENTGAAWANDVFTDQFDWVRENLPLKKHGFSLWLEARDRKATFTPHATRKDNYHHPRHLMLNLMSLERMVEKKGKVSGVFG
ncbi:AGE family epimerase/isomerase [Candidatus Latescibacterota bacterium]